MLNLLKPVIKAFDENGDRDNMLQSVVLELLEYIRKVCTGAVCLFANHDSACYVIIVI